MLAPDQEARIREILAAAPIFSGMPAESIAPLEGGVTNSNYLVRIGGRQVVLRINGATSALLGIDRASEAAATSAAASMGLAPAVLAVIQPQGYLVTEFVAGQHLAMDEMRTPATLARVAALLRHVHALAPIAGSFSPFRAIEHYVELARAQGGELPANLGALLDRMAAIMAEHQANPAPPCLCHNDLGRKNFIADGAALRLLDWEYAGMGDPLFDLANFAMAHQLSAEQEMQLLQAYGPPAPHQAARFQQLKFIAALREATWAVVQARISSIDFPYQRYASGIFGWLSRQV